MKGFWLNCVLTCAFAFFGLFAAVNCLGDTGLIPIQCPALNNGCEFPGKACVNNGAATTCVIPKSGAGCTCGS
jgi:hypothetical protein